MSKASRWGAIPATLRSFCVDKIPRNSMAMVWSNVIDTCIKHYIYTVYMHAHSVWIDDKLPGKQTTLGSSTVLLNHMLRSPAFSVEWKNGRACYMRLQPYWAMLVHVSIQTTGRFLVHPTQDLQRQQELLASGAASTARLASALVPWCPFLKLFWLDTKSWRLLQLPLLLLQQHLFHSQRPPWMQLRSTEKEVQ